MIWAWHDIAARKTQWLCCDHMGRRAWDGHEVGGEDGTGEAKRVISGRI